MKLVLVHGRGQEDPTGDPNRWKAELLEQWRTVLSEGFAHHGLDLPPGVQIVMPFYGDRLYKFAEQGDVPLSEEILSRGGAADGDYLAFRGAVLEEIRAREGVTDAQVTAELEPGPQERGPQNWNWVIAIARALDKHVPSVSSAAIEVWLRDVFLYAKRPGVRSEIDTLVAADLSEEPSVVIGHSLGSVVSYWVLREDHRSLKVPLFLTVGCPLAIRPIRDEFRPLKSPSHVSHWLNAFDRRDCVALHPLDGTHFPVQPAVENYGEVANGTSNRHGIAGYLNDPVLAKRIHEALTG